MILVVSLCPSLYLVLGTLLLILEVGFFNHIGMMLNEQMNGQPDGQCELVIYCYWTALSL